LNQHVLRVRDNMDTAQQVMRRDPSIGSEEPRPAQLSVDGTRVVCFEKHSSSKAPVPEIKFHMVNYNS
jgi:hypothetical protein